MNIALFLLLIVQLHHQTLSSNFHLVLENGDNVVLPSKGVSQETITQCRKCKTMKCIKEKCENVFLAIVLGCKLCKKNKACQKKRCPKRKKPAPSKPQLGGKGVGDGTEGMCSWCRKNRRMWVCKCLSCSNKKRKCPKFCGHWYYKQLFACKKKKGSNADGDGNYAKEVGLRDDKDLNR